MTELFLTVVNRSISAAWLVLAVLLLRLLLKTAPKWVNVLLWSMVAVRLICPVTVESALSLIPSAETVSPQIMTDPTPSIQSGIPAINDAVNPILTQTFAPAPGASANPLQILLPILATVWLAGAVLMLVYTAVSYLRLRSRVKTAVLLRDNLYQSEYVASPFVLGLLRPRIYLPFGMTQQDMRHVTAHEQAHIRRRDHWWKPLGFLLLTLHWFNPLLWIGYLLLCRDIELACDEKVIRELDPEQRADYSQALLGCSVSRRTVAACPLAFGEVGVKERIRSVLHYRKPGFWIVLIAMILCIAAAVCFLTSPMDRDSFGVTALRVTESGWSEAYVDIDYLDIYSYSVRPLSPVEPEYTGDGMTDYDGSLGKYRIGIFLGDALPSTDLLRQYPPGQVHTLEGLSNTFGGRLFLKTACPDDSTLVIYLGSDLPLAVEERDTTKLPLPKGRISLKLSLQTPTGNMEKTTCWFCLHFNEACDLPEPALSNEIKLAELPGTVFTRLDDFGPLSLTDGTGTVTLFDGMPVWNAFFRDLTGDGIPELCATAHFGSGIVDARIAVYDPTTGATYMLEDRMKFDYTLSVSADGALTVTQWDYFTSEVLAEGSLIFTQDENTGEGTLLFRPAGL